MATIAERLEHLTYENHLMASADSGYPIVYLSGEEELCAECATKDWFGYTDNDGDMIPANQSLTGYYIHQEGMPVGCRECDAPIKSAYGDPDGCAYCQEVNEAPYAYVTTDQAADSGDPLYECFMDARDGDVVCAEHARWCVLCRQPFAPTQFENHILEGECPGVQEWSVDAQRDYLFPVGTRVLVPRANRNTEGTIEGMVVGITRHDNIAVLTAPQFATDPARGHLDTYADWCVKLANLR